MVKTLDELAADASQEAVALARTLLEQDVADREWAAQLGPALSQRSVARLLGKTEQAVAKDPRLLRIRKRDGRPVYPVFQFDGRRLHPRTAEAVRALADALDPLPIASWLTGRNRSLEGWRPDVLRTADPEPTLALARRLARRAARRCRCRSPRPRPASPPPPTPPRRSAPAPRVPAGQALALVVRLRRAPRRPGHVRPLRPPAPRWGLLPRAERHRGSPREPPRVRRGPPARLGAAPAVLHGRRRSPRRPSRRLADRGPAWA